MPDVTLPGIHIDERSMKFVPDWKDLPTYESFPDFNFFLVWEPPRPGHQYVIGVDVSDGIGLDRSVIEVIRVATVGRPAEEVAQYVSRNIDPVDLAYVVDPIGRFYKDTDGFEAMVACETNNHGIATQSELDRHLGYSNFYVWQWEDVAPGTSRFSRRIGWVTSRRTRPIILTHLHRAVTTFDEATGQPDLVVNSPMTIDEMRDFQTEGQLWEAEAAPGSTDDCIMSLAIAYYVSRTLMLEGGETIEEQRRRASFIRTEHERMKREKGYRVDYINTDSTVDDMTDPFESGYEVPRF
jgi:hypothetical protein